MPTIPELQDTFTEAADTNLGSHTSDSGHTWTRVLGTTNHVVITSTGRLRGAATGTPTTTFRSSWTPPGADYFVTARLVAASSLAGLRFVLRCTADGSGYSIVWDIANNQYVLQRSITGTNTNLTTAATSGTGPRWVRGEIRGDKVRIWATPSNGAIEDLAVVLDWYTVDPVTDGLTGAGSAAINNGGANFTNTTRIQFDELHAGKDWETGDVSSSAGFSGVEQIAGAEPTDSGTAATVAVTAGAEVIAEAGAQSSSSNQAAAEARVDVGAQAAVASQSGSGALADGGTSAAVAVPSDLEALAQTGVLTSVAVPSGVTPAADLSDSGTAASAASPAGSGAIVDGGTAVSGSLQAGLDVLADSGAQTATAAHAGQEAAAETGAAVAVAVLTDAETVTDAGGLSSVGVQVGPTLGAPLPFLLLFPATIVVDTSIQSGDVTSAAAHADLEALVDSGVNVSRAQHAGIVPQPPSTPVVTSVLVVGDQDNTSFTTRSGNLALGTGGNRAVYLFTAVRDNNVNDVVSATLNGVAFTKLPPSPIEPTTNAVQMEVWRILEADLPAGGTTYPVSITLANATNRGGFIAVAMQSVSQTDPNGAVAPATGTSTAPAVSVSSAAGDIALEAVLYRGSAAVPSATYGDGQTALGALRTGSGDLTSDVGLNVSSEAGAASVAATWSLTASVQWAAAALSVHGAVLVTFATGDVTSGAVHAGLQAEAETGGVTSVASQAGTGVSAQTSDLLTVAQVDGSPVTVDRGDVSSAAFSGALYPGTDVYPSPSLYPGGGEDAASSGAVADAATSVSAASHAGTAVLLETGSQTSVAIPGGQDIQPQSGQVTTVASQTVLPAFADEGAALGSSTHSGSDAQAETATSSSVAVLTGTSQFGESLGAGDVTSTASHAGTGTLVAIDVLTSGSSQSGSEAQADTGAFPSITLIGDAERKADVGTVISTSSFAADGANAETGGASSVAAHAVIGETLQLPGDQVSVAVPDVAAGEHRTGGETLTFALLTGDGAIEGPFEILATGDLVTQATHSAAAFKIETTDTVSVAAVSGDGYLTDRGQATSISVQEAAEILTVLADVTSGMDVTAGETVAEIADLPVVSVTNGAGAATERGDVSSVGTFVGVSTGAEAGTAVSVLSAAGLEGVGGDGVAVSVASPSLILETLRATQDLETVTLLSGPETVRQQGAVTSFAGHAAVLAVTDDGFTLTVAVIEGKRKLSGARGLIRGDLTRGKLTRMGLSGPVSR